MIQWQLDWQHNLNAHQRFDRPSVYLDHWAVRRFAANPTLGERFAAGLEVANGTWAISLVNLLEFIAMTDEGQAAECERLIDRVHPRVFFIDFVAPTVAERERALQSGGPRDAPYGDTELLGVYAASGKNSLSGFSAKELIRVIVQQRHRLRQQFQDFQSNIAAQMTVFREEVMVDAELQKRIKGSQAAACAMPALLMMREVLGNIMLDPAKKITPNDAIDFMHTVVPVAYCDFALLDAQWKHRVSSVVRRFREQNLQVRVARVFGGTPEDLEALFEAVRMFNPTPACG